MTTLILSNHFLLREWVSFTRLPRAIPRAHGTPAKESRLPRSCIWRQSPIFYKIEEAHQLGSRSQEKKKREDKLDAASAARSDPEVGGAFRAGIGPCSRTGSARTAGPGHAHSGSIRPRDERWAWRPGRRARGRPEPAPSRPGPPAQPPPGLGSGAPLPPSLRLPGSSPAAPGPRTRAGRHVRVRGRDPPGNLAGQTPPHSSRRGCSASASAAASGASCVTWSRAGWRRVRESQAAAWPPERGWR